MSKASVNALIGIALAAFLAVVLVRGRLAVLLAALSQEIGFAKWGAAFLLWKAVAFGTTGRARAFVETTGNLAIVTALVIGATKNAAATKRLTDGIIQLIK